MNSTPINTPDPAAEPPPSCNGMQERMKLLGIIEHCSPIGIAMTDMDGRILFVNDHLCKLTGWDTNELTGDNPPRLFRPPEDLKGIAPIFTPSATAETPPKELELQILCKSGELFQAQLLLNPFFDNQQQQTGWVASIIDITRRYNAEQELKRSNERLRLMVEVSQFKAANVQDLLDFSLDKVVALTGSAIGYIYHYHEDRQEFVLNTWSKEVMPACSVAEPQTVYRLEKTGIWGEVVRQRCPLIINDYPAANPLKKGCPEGHIPLQRFMSIPVLEGDRIVAVVGVGNKLAPYDNTDVEQLKLMMNGVWSYVRKLDLETRLQAIRERFEFALTTGKLAIWEWNPATGLLEWSDSVDSMLGYDRGEFPRTMSAWTNSLHPEDRNPVLAVFQRHLKENSAYSIDYRIRQKNGDYCYWYDTAITFRNNDGQPLRMIGSCVDITERKQAEINLKQMQAQLIQQEKMASIGQLAAGVAHEINNPVGFIASNLSTLGKYLQRLDDYIKLLEESLLERSNGKWPDIVEKNRVSLKIGHILADLGELMNESMEGIDRVKNIVADLKSFSRSDDLKMALVDINKCLHTTLNIVRNEYKYVAELVLDLQELLPPVRGNSQQLSQVIANLLVNAAHAIDGHGTIRIKTWTDDGDLLLSISDTGNGIKPEHLEQIFEPFFTTKEIGKGTGLGLSICYDIIQKHQGKITVESMVGQGSTFTVRLPVCSNTPS